MLSLVNHFTVLDPSTSPQLTGHSFIFRQYDIRTISLTSMFCGAFPTAGAEDEHKEIQWTKYAYSNNENDTLMITPLTGTWVSPEIASLPVSAECYHLSHIIEHLLEAIPDPEADYWWLPLRERRSRAMGV